MKLKPIDNNAGRIYRAKRFLTHYDHQLIKNLEQITQGSIIALCNDGLIDVREVLAPEIFSKKKHRVEYDTLVYEQQFRGLFCLNEKYYIVREEFWNYHENRDQRKAYLRKDSEEQATITYSNEIKSFDLGAPNINAQGIFDVTGTALAEYMLEQSQQLEEGRKKEYRNDPISAWIKEKILDKKNANYFARASTD